MKILVIEDEHKIANSIKKGLELESYAVDVAYDGEVGYDLASGEPYAAIILDLMLPKMDGMVLCRNLRKNGNHTPIIMLTAKGELDDKVAGLNTGADDYMVKPFAFSELVARIKALTRRPQKTIDSTLTIDDLELNTNDYLTTRKGKPINLSKKEFSLLEFLMMHPGKILTKDTLIQNVWSYEADVLPNTVEVYIGYLRKKIDNAFPDSKPLIHTVRGFGYKIDSSN